jgi:hypothetical protein
MTTQHHQSTRRLQIKRYAATNVDYKRFSAYRLRVEAVEAVNMDKNVFLYRRDPINPYTNDVTDTFFTVCSPADIAEFPVGTPNPGNVAPFFRNWFIELDFRTSQDAMNAWQLLVAELSNLVEAYDRLEDLALVEDFWIGPYPEPPFHGSASISEPIEP